MPFPDCSKCSRPENGAARARWGCDTVADSPVFSTSCSKCGGVDHDCERCKGTNEVAWFRCPSNVLGDAGPHAVASVRRALSAYHQYDSRHTLPVAGGWCDQSPSFAQTVEIIDAERGWWEAKRQAKLERERKAAEMKAQQGRR